MTIDLIDKKPEDTIEFMISWLDEHGVETHKDHIWKSNRPIGVETSDSE